jgi:predicted RNase H-like HicB family nuclease
MNDRVGDPGVVEQAHGAVGDPDDEYGHYSMILEWDPRDRIYIATVPELPGCRTHGATLEEAVRQGRNALEGWIDGAREDGWRIPVPRFFDPDGSRPPGWGE